MTDKDIKHAVRNCEWKSNNHYDLGGIRNLHKGICIAKGSICYKVIEEGRCPILQELFQREAENGISKNNN